MRQEGSLPEPLFSSTINHVVKKIGETVSWVYALLMAVIIFQIVLRKGFSNGLIILEELQWHLYAIGFMFGMAYSQAMNSHVRADLFYHRFSSNIRHVIEIIGLLIFVLPFIYIVFIHSLDFVADSWRTSERSPAPAGLPYRWAIKSIIPVAFSLLALIVVARIYHEASMLLKNWRT